MDLYRRLHDRFGTAGVVIAVVALIAALGGTALAAGGLTGKQKKEVTKIAKKYAGKPGAAGAAGANGSNGKDGAPGTAGAPGADGKSVEAEAASTAKCPEGGTVFKIAGVEKGKACNGEEGEEGPEGEPWAAGGTLPSGATETGGFAALAPESAVVEALSFPIHLGSEISATNVHVEPVGFAGTAGGDCPGTVTAPCAKRGHLCVYVGSPEAAVEIESPQIKKLDNSGEGSSTAGALFKVFSVPGDIVSGSFAVTAP